MKIFIFLLFISISANSQNLEIKYPQNIFDSDTCCWRKLGNLEKYDKAADLIVEYLQNGNTQNRQSLKWHAGQLFAMAQNNKMAIKYFNKSSNIFYYWFGGDDGKTWYLYVKGVKAFVKRDKEKLIKIIAVWENKFPVDLNYKQLTLLLTNWNEAYHDAVK